MEEIPYKNNDTEIHILVQQLPKWWFPCLKGLLCFSQPVRIAKSLLKSFHVVGLLNATQKSTVEIGFVVSEDQSAVDGIEKSNPVREGARPFESEFANQDGVGAHGV